MIYSNAFWTPNEWWCSYAVNSADSGAEDLVMPFWSIYVNADITFLAGLRYQKHFGVEQNKSNILSMTFSLTSNATDTENRAEAFCCLVRQCEYLLMK